MFVPASELDPNRLFVCDYCPWRGAFGDLDTPRDSAVVCPDCGQLASFAVRREPPECD